ncbi:hypothetical protein GCM10020295_46690 [Streptomyces cinereospinus]
MVIIVQGGMLILDEDPAPLDCVSATLSLHGSTALAPALQEAARSYAEACRGARIPVSGLTFTGSGPGITELERAARTRRSRSTPGSPTTSPSPTAPRPATTPACCAARSPTRCSRWSCTRTPACST